MVQLHFLGWFVGLAVGPDLLARFLNIPNYDPKMKPLLDVADRAGRPSCARIRLSRIYG